MASKKGDACFSGYLVKKSRGKSAFGSMKAASWQEREFSLYINKKLTYSDAGVVKGEIDCDGCQVRKLTEKEAGAKDGVIAYHFEIKSNAGDVLILAADAEWRRDKWCSQIEAVNNGTWVAEVSEAVSKLPPSGQEHKTEPHIKEKLNNFCSQSATCADCNAPHPSWASVNNGVVICTACSGVHRALGVHISFVQSLNMDFWDGEAVEAFCQLGPNSKVNRLKLEFSVPMGVFKASPNCSREDRERWIRRKYVDQAFAPQVDGSGKTVNKSSPPVSMEDVVSVFGAGGGGGAEGTECDRSPVKSIGETEFIGVLMIKLVQCKNLVKIDMIGKNDVYIRATAALQSVDSKVVSKSQDPAFNQTIMLSWDGTSSLELHTLAKTTKKSKEALGSLTIDLSDSKASLESGEVLELIDHPLSDTSSGTISVEVSFTCLT